MKLKDLFKPKIVEKIVYKEPEIRQGWFIREAGQNPLCCFWYCVLMSFDLKDDDGNAKFVYVEDCDTFNEAIALANRKAEEMEKKQIEKIDHLNAPVKYKEIYINNATKEDENI